MPVNYPTLQTLPDHIASRLNITYDRSADNEIKLLLQSRNLLDKSDTRDPATIVSEQLIKLAADAKNQTDAANQFLDTIKENLPTHYHRSLVLIGSAAIDMHGFGISDFDFMLPFSTQHDHKTKLNELKNNLGHFINSIEESNISRSGSLLRLKFNDKKVDLLLVSKSDYNEWIEGITTRWHEVSPTIKHKLKKQKLLAYLRGGSFYPNMKCLTYYALLPNIRNWFTWRQPGDMCTALTSIHTAASSDEAWACTRRHTKEDIFCTEHKADYKQRTLTNLQSTSTQFSPLPVLINAEWLKTANLTGAIIALSGPSCVGKSTIAGSIRQQVPDIQSALSMTTRQPRNSEKHGIDYYYTNKEKFNKLVIAGTFFENSTIYNNQYGKPWASLLPPLLQGKLLIVDLHPDTIHHYRKRLPASVTIKTLFLTPPTPITLKIRLYDREQGCKGKATGNETLGNPDNQLRYDESLKEHNKICNDPNHYALFDAILISGDGERGAYSLDRVIREVHLVCSDLIKKFEKPPTPAITTNNTNQYALFKTLTQHASNPSRLWALITGMMILAVALNAVSSLTSSATPSTSLNV